MKNREHEPMRKKSKPVSKRRVRSAASTRRRQQNAGAEYMKLEDRLALTVFVVNTTLDTATDVEDGLVSLREAVIAANTNAAFGDAPAGDTDGDVIRFDTSIADSEIGLFQGQINITDDVFIQGGDRDITINGRGIQRHFAINSTERVGFSKLTFINGRGTEGGSILAQGSGNTLISESTFNFNNATGVGGGALFNAAGVMSVISSDFVDNQASATGTAGRGGAVFTQAGTMYVNGGTMFTNRASGSGGAIEVEGGTFYSVGLQVGDVGRGNEAGTSQLDDGGGLHISGFTFTTISGGSFVGNSASRSGGGLAIEPGSGGGNLFINNAALVDQNIAVGAFENNGGGGIFNNGGSLFVTNAIVSNNQATGAMSMGGGILGIGGSSRATTSTINDNAAVEAGGGFALVDGFGLLNDSTLTANDVGVTLTGGTGIGGGVYVQGSAASNSHTDNPAVLVVNDGQLAGNQSLIEGGGIWGGGNSQVFIRNDASLLDNLATAVSVGKGGGVYTEGYLQVLDSFFQRNDANIFGGGIYVKINGSLRVNNSLFTANLAGFNGGGIYTESTTNRITGTSFINNIVSTAGGGIFVSTTGSLSQANNRFSGNQPDDVSGA